MSVLKQDEEYAGFHYTILKEHGMLQVAPHKGQHPAAGKEKHLRAVADQYSKNNPGW